MAQKVSKFWGEKEDRIFASSKPAQGGQVMYFSRSWRGYPYRNDGGGEWADHLVEYQKTGELIAARRARK